MTTTFFYLLFALHEICHCCDIVLRQMSTSVKTTKLTLVTRIVTIMWELSTVVATVDMSFTTTLNVLNKVCSDDLHFHNLFVQLFAACLC